MSEDLAAVERTRALVASVVPDDIADADDDEDLRDYGLDSIRLLDLVAALNREGADVEFADVVATPTLRALARLIPTSGKESTS